MSDDLVQRLRSEFPPWDPRPLMREAADEIVRLQADNQQLEEDVLRILRVRNEALLAAASEMHPGPDGQDYLDRERLIREWVDEGHERVDEKNRQLTEAVARYASTRAEVVRLQADNQRMAKVYELAARSAHAASLFQGGAGGRDNPQAVAVHMAEWFEEQEAEVVRLQQALRDLLDAEDDFHVKAKQTHDSASAHAFLASSKARDRALAAARAVLNGDQQ